MQVGKESNVKSSLHHDKIIDDTSTDIVDVMIAVLEASMMITTTVPRWSRIRI